MDYATRSNLISQLNKKMNQPADAPKKFNGYFNHATGTYFSLTKKDCVTPIEMEEIQTFLYNKFKASTGCAADSLERNAYALAIEAIEKLKEAE